MFIGKDNQSFVQYLEKNTSNYTCLEIEDRPFYVTGAKYIVNKRKYYRVYFEEGWAVNAPNAYKRDCSTYEGFLTAKIVRIEVIKRGEMVKVIE